MSLALAMETSATAMDSRVFVERSRDALQQLAVLIRNSYLHDLGNPPQNPNLFHLEPGSSSTEQLFTKSEEIRADVCR